MDRKTNHLLGKLKKGVIRIGQPRHRRNSSVSQYYEIDFRFLDRYVSEFGSEFRVEGVNSISIYLSNWHIANIELALPYAPLRMYKIVFHPEFSSVILEEGYRCKWGCGFVPYVEAEAKGDYSVIVGPELLDFWIHKLIWEAIEVIDYKRLH